MGNRHPPPRHEPRIQRPQFQDSSWKVSRDHSIHEFLSSADAVPDALVFLATRDDVPCFRVGENSIDASFQIERPERTPSCRVVQVEDRFGLLSDSSRDSLVAVSQNATHSFLYSARPPPPRPTSVILYRFRTRDSSVDQSSLKRYEALVQLDGHDGAIMGLGTCPPGSPFYSPRIISSDEHNVFVFELVSGQRVQTMSVQSGRGLTHIHVVPEWSPEEVYLAPVASGITRYSLVRECVIGRYDGVGYPEGIAYDVDHGCFYTSDQSRTVCVWDRDTCRCLDRREGGERSSVYFMGPRCNLCYVQGQNLLLVGSLQGGVIGACDTRKLGGLAVSFKVCVSSAYKIDHVAGNLFVSVHTGQVAFWKFPHRVLKTIPLHGCQDECVVLNHELQEATDATESERNSFLERFCFVEGNSPFARIRVISSALWIPVLFLFDSKEIPENC